MIRSKIATQPIEEDLGFVCCFCNKSITSLDLDASDINIIANIDKPKNRQANQYFYCHLQCFKKKIS